MLLNEYSYRVNMSGEDDLLNSVMEQIRDRMNDGVIPFFIDPNNSLSSCVDVLYGIVSTFSNVAKVYELKRVKTPDAGRYRYSFERCGNWNCGEFSFAEFFVLVYNRREESKWFRGNDGNGVFESSVDYDPRCMRNDAVSGRQVVATSVPEFFEPVGGVCQKLVTLEKDHPDAFRTLQIARKKNYEDARDVDAQLIELAYDDVVERKRASDEKIAREALERAKQSREMKTAQERTTNITLKQWISMTQQSQPNPQPPTLYQTSN